MPELISFGAGINSVAMTVLLLEGGWTGPIVFADTWSEYPETYAYLDYFEQDYLQRHGLTITRLEPGSPYHTRAQDSIEDYCLQRRILPLLNKRWCSTDWKIRPINRWAKAHGYDVQLLGMTVDEPHRVRDGSHKRYPLVDHDVTRQGCRRIIHRAGLEQPHKSNCFFCPGQNYAEFRQLYHDHPDLYERAIALEDTASLKKGSQATLDRNRQSLRQLRAQRWHGQIPLAMPANPQSPIPNPKSGGTHARKP